MKIKLEVSENGEFLPLTIEELQEKVDASSSAFKRINSPVTGRCIFELANEGHEVDIEEHEIGWLDA